MRSPLPNSLAVVVLLALLIAWLTSVVVALGSQPVRGPRSWYSLLPAVFGMLGVPAAIDLLQTTGVPLALASIAAMALVLNIAVPIWRILRESAAKPATDWDKWLLLASTIGGLAVSGYLTFVDSAGGQVACGPSGGCQTVQTSRYAVLFGVLPVATLGLLGYIGILIGWLVQQVGPAAWKKPASLAIWAMCLFGVAFSIYLTSLEPFVIGATCMWCISSAVLMGSSLMVSTPLARQALAFTDDSALDALTEDGEI